jgi:hypothetical protein
MHKAKREIGREILNGLRDIKRGRHGRVVNLPSVASIREKTGLSQERFAALLQLRFPQGQAQGSGSPHRPSWERWSHSRETKKLFTSISKRSLVRGSDNEEAQLRD